MKTITEETFCHDFDEIMDAVMLNKESFIITTADGSDVVLVPYDYYERIQGELTQLVE
jgi:PHD/YefM family antitoxin component YafN of YafNO toxin-antitoxin module